MNDVFSEFAIEKRTVELIESHRRVIAPHLYAAMLPVCGHVHS